jgi:NDP-sugar pyrophosphorylase family protein
MLDYCALCSNLTVKMGNGDVEFHNNDICDWTTELIDTGLKTQTGGRIKRLAPYLGNETFMLTWGDGVADIDINKLLAFHRAHGKLATLTAVRPPARFGHLDLDGDTVGEFSEKPQTREIYAGKTFTYFRNRKNFREKSRLCTFISLEFRRRNYRTATGLQTKRGEVYYSYPSTSSYINANSR